MCSLPADMHDLPFWRNSTPLCLDTHKKKQKWYLTWEQETECLHCSSLVPLNAEHSHSFLHQQDLAIKTCPCSLHPTIFHAQGASFHPPPTPSATPVRKSPRNFTWRHLSPCQASLQHQISCPLSPEAPPHDRVLPRPALPLQAPLCSLVHPSSSAAGPEVLKPMLSFLGVCYVPSVLASTALALDSLRL